MKTILISIILCFICTLSYATTATLTDVDGSSDGVSLSVSITDATLGTWTETYQVTNATLLQYTTWISFRDTVLVPLVQSSIADKQAVYNRVNFLKSKLNQTLTIP